MSKNNKPVRKQKPLAKLLAIILIAVFVLSFAGVFLARGIF